MKKFRQARCPHCGEKVSLLRSWAIKTQGEYKCPQCNGISNIELDPAIHLFALLAVILGGLIYVITMFVVKTIGLIAIASMILPYLVFYLLSIFLVRLRKPTVRKKTTEGKASSVRTQRKEKQSMEDSNIENTIIMENFSQYSK